MVAGPGGPACIAGGGTGQLTDFKRWSRWSRSRNRTVLVTSTHTRHLARHQCAARHGDLGDRKLGQCRHSRRRCRQIDVSERIAERRVDQTRKHGKPGVGRRRCGDPANHHRNCPLQQRRRRAEPEVGDLRSLWWASLAALQKPRHRLALSRSRAHEEQFVAERRPNGSPVIAPLFGSSRRARREGRRASVSLPAPTHR